MPSPPATPGKLPSPRLDTTCHLSNGPPPSPELFAEDVRKEIDEFEQFFLAMQSKKRVFQTMRSMPDTITKLQAAYEFNVEHLAHERVTNSELLARCEQKDTTIARLQAEADQLPQKVATIKQLEDSLKKAKASVESLSKTVLALKDDKEKLQKRLDDEGKDKDSAIESHRVTKEKLCRLESYALPPKSLPPHEM